MPKHVSRRTVTQALVGTALVALPPSFLLPANTALPSSFPELFSEMLVDIRRAVVAPFGSDELSGLLAAGRELMHALDTTDVGGLAVSIVGGELTDLTSSSVAEVRTRIAQKIRADFAAGHTVTAAGWILSHTELMILALAAGPIARDGAGA